MKYLLCLLLSGCSLMGATGPVLNTVDNSHCGGLKLEARADTTLPQYIRDLYPQVDVTVCAR